MAVETRAVETGALAQLGALRQKLARADPKFEAAARAEAAADDLCQDLRRQLKARRTSAGLNQEDLARRLELSQSAISKIESGRGDLGVKTLFRVADALGMRPVVTLADSSDATQASETERASDPALAAAAALEAAQETLLRQIPEVFQGVAARLAEAG